jgi:amidase
MTDICFLDATDQLKALAARQISACELLDLLVKRTDALHARLNAVVSRDLGRARAAARAIDERRVQGENLGPLAGLPMTVKDALDVEGLPASAGVKKLTARMAVDAKVVSRVRSADAIVWGKTNTPVNAADWQTYNALYGTTNNPWNLKLTPGGSSGGSSVALSAGMTALEIGADIAGSLRIPASFCGVFAHKPTYGLVSQRGLVPPPGFLADIDMAVVGPMARSARDLRLLLSIISESNIPAKAPSAELKGLKAALWLDEPSFTLDPEVKSSILSSVALLADTGLVLEAVTSPVAAKQMMFAYVTLLLAITGAGLLWPDRALYEFLRGPAKIARAVGAKPLSWAHSILSLTARHREWLRANEARAQLGEIMKSFFTRFDILIAPISPIAAFPHDHRPLPLRKLMCSDGRVIPYLEMLNWIALATILGLPSTVVPAGLTKGGLPVGVQIIGPCGGDALTLSVAQAIEERIGGFRAPPLCVNVSCWHMADAPAARPGRPITGGTAATACRPGLT